MAGISLALLLPRYGPLLNHHFAERQFMHRRPALLSQYPMLALMVGYTVVSLWTIAQPIVETGAGA